MTITIITVTAGRTFNHPHESYSNLRPEVTMTATLAPGEHAEGATRRLQATAEQLVEDHKRAMLQSIQELHQMSEQQAELRGLQEQLERTQARLEAIRSSSKLIGVAQNTDPV
ncbi:MAG: hypothetical protein ACOYD4_04105 [Solirubrobacterales bacterium]